MSPPSLAVTSRRRAALVVGLVAMAAAAGLGVTAHHLRTAASNTSRPAAVTAPARLSTAIRPKHLRYAAIPAAWPSVGHGIGATTRTCTRGVTRRTAVTGAQCSAWAPSGPVNVVIYTVHGGTAPNLTGGGGHFVAAQGGWLVLQGSTDASATGCVAGWHDSGAQIELRLDRFSRRHFKFIPSGCAVPGGVSVTFGEAHTDGFDLRKCGGDHVIDFNAARAAIEARLRALPQLVAIEERPAQPAGTAYAAGCGREVKSDGIVVYAVFGSG